MKILLVSADDANDPNAWSGTAFQARVAMEATGHEVVVLTGLPTTRLPWHLALRLLLGNDRYPLWTTVSTLRGLGRRLEQAERRHRPDVILAISSQYVVKARLQTPVVMFSDAPWQTFHERYKPYQPFPWMASRYERLEATAARSATRLVYSSHWGKKEAVRLFGVPPGRVEVVPLGANWTPAPAGPAPAVFEGPLRLLFVGRDWKRKGGELAVSVLQAIQDRGVDAELTVVGVDTAKLGSISVMRGVRSVGPTPILREDTSAKMKALFNHTHFLFVPSRAECFGIVYAEAAAFGRPSVALDVDAVSEVVDDGVTGLLFPPTTHPSDLADRILEVYRERTSYNRLARQARNHYEKVLNWQAFGRKLMTVLYDTARAPSAQQSAESTQGDA